MIDISVNAHDIANPINRITSRNIMYPIYIPTTIEIVAPQTHVSLATTAKPAKQPAKLMMIPKQRELFCFNIFLLFTIINDIFFNSCVIRRIGRFLFQGLQWCRILGQSRFFQKILPEGVEII